MASVVSVAVYAGPFPTFTLERALEDALLDTALDMLNEYESLTDDWDTSPEFDVDLEVGEDYEVMVYTFDPVFTYVNDGTGQAAGNRSDWYPIEPVNARNLAYREEFEPKTRPGSLVSDPTGGKYGDYIVRDMVFHPGITPRNFDAEVERLYGKVLERRLSKILTDYAQSARKKF